jgi:hypothetical protein
VEIPLRLSVAGMMPVLIAVIVVVFLALAFTLGLVALLRCDKDDVPAVVRGLAQ